MKKVLILAVLASTAIGAVAYSAGYIELQPGQTIVLDGTTVSCSASTSPQNPAIECNRLKNMASEDVYNLGISEGVGYCYILNNNGYFGVMHTKGKQISPSYDQDHNGSSTYDPANITVATAFVQLVCNGACFRP